MADISDQAIQRPWNRYKYNGIELDTSFGVDEYEAGLRNLDPQIGRWWQIDPNSSDSANEMERWSPYVSNYDNPITYKDPKGDCPACWGFVIGALVDYGSQVINNLGKESISDALTDINLKEVGVAAVTGALTGGVSAIENIAMTQTSKVVVNATIDATASYATQKIEDPGKAASLTQVAISAVSGEIGGRIGSEIPAIKVNEKAAKNLTEGAQAAVGNVVSTLLGNGLGKVGSNKTQPIAHSLLSVPPNSSSVQDATANKQVVPVQKIKPNGQQGNGQ
jgi:RHS repeat-associated protein